MYLYIYRERENEKDATTNQTHENISRKETEDPTHMNKLEAT